jgi:hypothetical protein
VGVPVRISASKHRVDTVRAPLVWSDIGISFDTPPAPAATDVRVPPRVDLGGRRPPAWLLPVALLGALMLTIWLVSDVPLPAALRFIGYEVGFVGVPGWLIYSALTRRARFDLRHVVVAWALGYAAELAVFAATASVGARTAYDFYPLAVAIVTGPFVLPLVRAGFERRADRPRGRTPGWAWALTGLLAFAFVDIAVEQFPLYRLPWKLPIGQLFYWPYDWMMANSIATDALQHWPASAPNVAGVTLHYHYFAFLHMSAISQVTKLDVFLVNFRFVTMPLVILSTLLAFVLGRKLSGGKPWVGFAAAFLAFFVGAPSVVSLMFAGILIALLLIGRRTNVRAALVAGAGVAVVLGLTYDTWNRALTHPQATVNSIWSNVFDTPSFALGMVLFLAVAVELSDRLTNPTRIRDRLGSWVVIAALMAAATGAKAAVPSVMAPGLVIALAYAARYERRAVRTLATALGLCVATFGVAWLLVFSGGEEGEIHLKPGATARDLLPHFSHQLKPHSGAIGAHKLILYGIVTLIALAYMLALLAPGIWLVLRLRRWRPTVTEAWLIGMLVTGTGLALAFVANGNGQMWFYMYGYTAGAIVAAVGFAQLWRRRVAAPRSRWVTAAALASILVALSVTTAAPRTFAQAIFSGAAYTKVPANDTYLGFNRPLYEGLLWVRKHSTSNDVLAVNTVFNPRACYYAAFSERRFLMECSFPETVRHDVNLWPRAYPDRFKVNEGIFRHGDPAALRTARDKFGVRYLIVDLIPGHGGSEQMVATVRRLAPIVYRNSAVVVFRVRS